MPTFNPYFYTNTAERVESILRQDAETVGTEHRWAENDWTGPGRFVDEKLEGDDSQLIGRGGCPQSQESSGLCNQPFGALFFVAGATIGSSEISAGCESK